MTTVTFYPTYHYPDHDVIHYYSHARYSIKLGANIETTQMALLNDPHVKDYDIIRIVQGPDDVIEITNNHDGTYSCDRTKRKLRRVHNFLHLWKNGEFEQ